jgi:hypothetical protein
MIMESSTAPRNIDGSLRLRFSYTGYFFILFLFTLPFTWLLRFVTDLLTRYPSLGELGLGPEEPKSATKPTRNERLDEIEIMQ